MYYVPEESREKASILSILDRMEAFSDNLTCIRN